MTERPKSEQSIEFERLALEGGDVYRQILDAIADMVLVKGPGSRILWANRAFCEYYGMTNEELANIIDAPFSPRDNTARFLRDDAYVFTTKQVLDIPEEPVTRHDGLIQVFHTVKSPVLDQRGEAALTVGVSRNITERKRVKEDLARYREHLEGLVEARTRELRSASDRLQTIVASLVEGIVAVDAEGRVQLLNPRAEALLGTTSSAALGQPLRALLRLYNEATEVAEGAPEFVEFDRVLTAQRPIVGVLQPEEGLRVLVSVTSSPLLSADQSPLGSVVVLRDIGLEREVEQQRLRQQKLESLGVLAGGIAHDFNNILMGILGSLSIARLRLDSREEVGGILEQAEQACLRARTLTTQLLTFAKGGAPVKRVLFLRGVARDSAELALRGSNARLEFSCVEPLSAIEGDEGQLTQVISNLVLNAQQAMPDGGTVFLRLDTVELAQALGSLATGRYVRVEVEDTGCGIEPQNLSRIFDPYFTTKPSGNGLGLASVHSIVQRHDGHVAVDSQLGRGTRFTVYLPAVEPSAVEPSRPAGSEALRSRRVLVLDNDEMIRNVVTPMLERLGHTVVAAGSSAEAIAAFDSARAQGGPFEVVLVDLTMPGDLGAGAVIERLRALDPSAKFIVMSGYSVDPLRAESQRLGLVGTLQKPFTIEALAHMLARCARD
ncbi:MAG TPA: ATP-binding protein [Polyangiaceae bacterium]|nr:ATP-binding protein [Polyangiaceae bacterium]